MEITDIQNFFTSADTNGDNVLTAKEFKKSLNSQSIEVQETLSAFFYTNTKIDNAKFNQVAGSDKKMSYNELLSLLTTTDEEDNVTIADDDTLNQRVDEVANLSSLDINGDGKITAKEIKKIYKKSSDDSEVKNIASAFISTNNKGKLQVNKAKIRALSDGNKYITSSDLKKADADGDNTTTSDELASYLEKYEETSVLDINGNGKIKLSEIKKYAKVYTDSPLANYIASLTTSKEKKQVFKTLSDGKSYVTYDDLAKYDTDGNGVICEDELVALKNTVSGITTTTTTTTSTTNTTSTTSTTNTTSTTSTTNSTSTTNTTSTTSNTTSTTSTTAATSLEEIEEQLAEIKTKKATAMQNEDEYAQYQLEQQENTLINQKKELSVNEYVKESSAKGKTVSETEKNLLTYKIDCEFRKERIEEKQKYLEIKRQSIEKELQTAQSNGDITTSYTLEQQISAIDELNTIFEVDKTNIETQYNEANELFEKVNNIQSPSQTLLNAINEKLENLQSILSVSEQKSTAMQCEDETALATLEAQEKKLEEKQEEIEITIAEELAKANNTIFTSSDKTVLKEKLAIESELQDVIEEREYLNYKSTALAEQKLTANESNDTYALSVLEQQENNLNAQDQTLQAKQEELEKKLIWYQ